MFFNFFHRFYFTSSDTSVQFIYLSLILFCVHMFLEICPFLLLCPICWHTIIVSSHLCIFFITVVLIVISHLSFLILFIWVLFVFFVMSLARGLSILFIFSMNLFLVLLLFYYFTSLFC